VKNAALVYCDFLQKV